MWCRENRILRCTRRSLARVPGKGQPGVGAFGRRRAAWGAELAPSVPGYCGYAGSLYQMFCALKIF